MPINLNSQQDHNLNLAPEGWHVFVITKFKVKLYDTGRNTIWFYCLNDDDQFGSLILEMQNNKLRYEDTVRCMRIGNLIKSQADNFEPQMLVGKRFKGKVVAGSNGFLTIKEAQHLLEKKDGYLS